MGDDESDSTADKEIALNTTGLGSIPSTSDSPLSIARSNVISEHRTRSQL